MNTSLTSLSQPSQFISFTPEKKVCFHWVFKSYLTFMSNFITTASFAEFRVTNWLPPNQTCMYNGIVSTSCDRMHCLIYPEIQRNMLCANDHQSTLVSWQKPTLVSCDDECLSHNVSWRRRLFNKAEIVQIMDGSPEATFRSNSTPYFS